MRHFLTPFRKENIRFSHVFIIVIAINAQHFTKHGSKQKQTKLNINQRKRKKKV